MLERGENLSVLAYRKIEEMILSGELKPGDRINEFRFAMANGLSRGPVREACRALERDGLVVAVPAKGVYVREVSKEELDEIYDLRAVLTGFMCALAAKNKTERGCAELRKLNAGMREASVRGDQKAYYAANLRFHNTISEMAANETARRVYDGLAKETHAHRIAVLSTSESIAEHDAIIDAIAKGDREEARRQGEVHVLSGKRRWHEKRTGSAKQSKVRERSR